MSLEYRIHLVFKKLNIESAPSLKSNYELEYSCICVHCFKWRAPSIVQGKKSWLHVFLKKETKKGTTIFLYYGFKILIQNWIKNELLTWIRLGQETRHLKFKIVKDPFPPINNPFFPTTTINIKSWNKACVETNFDLALNQAWNRI